jgi:sortase A
MGTANGTDRLHVGPTRGGRPPAAAGGPPVPWADVHESVAAEPDVADAQPEPYRRFRDWRFYVGTLGKVLLCTGLLVLAFVAYQLWGTGIQAAQAQRDLEDEFEEALAAASTTVPPTTPATDAPPSTDSTGGSTVPSTAPATTAPATTVPPAPTVQEGDPLARLEIPAIGVDWIVVAGVRVEDLQRGPGHYPDTPLPGQDGNVAIAGHRTTYGAPFAEINELEPGDEIVLTTFTGRFVYRMSGQRIVPPTDASVLDPTPFPVLTLTSCHPKYSARERIIVQALFDAEASDGVLAPAMPGYAGSAASNPATVASTAPPTEPAESTVADDPGTTAASPATTPAPVAPTTAASASGTSSADALEQGWFDDAAAWPQVALWAAVLIAISLVGWRIGRAIGRNWVGAIIAAAPFLIALYFFFENVNRLLPPNL